MARAGSTCKRSSSAIASVGFAAVRTWYPAWRSARATSWRRLWASSTTRIRGWAARASDTCIGARPGSTRAGVPRPPNLILSWVCAILIRQSLDEVRRTQARESGRRETVLPDFNARAGIRTRTGLPPGDFKSRASTSFATRAGRPRNLARSGGHRLPPDARRRARAPGLGNPAEAIAEVAADFRENAAGPCLG